MPIVQPKDFRTREDSDIWKDYMEYFLTRSGFSYDGPFGPVKKKPVLQEISIDEDDAIDVEFTVVEPEKKQLPQE